jgi:serine/threonine protein kinase
MIPVVRALSCAHELGIVHRDLKPENIFLTTTGRVVVLDFGIAKHLDADHGSAIDAPAGPLPGDPGARAPQESTVLGTLLYMSPEQLRAKDIDARSDLWSAGIILFELVTGVHPLLSRSTFELFQLVDSEAPMPSVRDVCPEAGALGAIIDRCLRKRPEERYRSADDLLAALCRYT